MGSSVAESAQTMARNKLVFVYTTRISVDSEARSPSVGSLSQRFRLRCGEPQALIQESVKGGWRIREKGAQGSIGMRGLRNNRGDGKEQGSQQEQEESDRFFDHPSRKACILAQLPPGER